MSSSDSSSSASATDEGSFASAANAFVEHGSARAKARAGGEAKAINAFSRSGGRVSAVAHGGMAQAVTLGGGSARATATRPESFAGAVTIGGGRATATNRFGNQVLAVAFGDCRVRISGRRNGPEQTIKTCVGQDFEGSTNPYDYVETFAFLDTILTPKQEEVVAY